MLALFMICGGLASAQQITWNNSQGNRLWDDTSTNWSSTNLRFLKDDHVIFSDDAAGVVTISGANVFPASVQFSNTSGNQYTISSVSTEELTAADGLKVSDSGDATIASIIAGTTAITHEGTGSLTLSGANTFTGGIVVKSGARLVAGNDTALGSTSQATALTIDAGGTLDIGDSNLMGYLDRSIQVRGSGVGGNGAIVKSTGNNYNVFNGDIDFKGDTTIRNDLRLDFDGPLYNNTNASVKLTKLGSNTLFLANTIVGDGFDWDIRQGQITMEGAIDSSVNSSFTVNSGTILQKDRNNYIVEGNLVLNGGLLRVDGGAFIWNFSGNLNVTSQSIIDPAGAAAEMNFTGELSGASGLTIGSLGTVTFSGNSSNYTGGIIINSGGTLVINGDYSGATDTIRLRSGATLSGTGIWGGNVITEQGSTVSNIADSSNEFGEAVGLIIKGTISSAPVTFTAFSEVSGLATLPSQWRFYWNAPTEWSLENMGNLSSGAVTDRSSWRAMVWSGSMWTADGDDSENNSPSDHLRISSVEACTGAPGATPYLDRYAISAFTISQAGDYELLLGKIATYVSGNGVLVKIFLNGSQYDEIIVPSNNISDFSYIFNGLTLNDEIAVAVGSNGEGSNETYNLDYRIALLKPEYTNPTNIHVADYGAVGDGVTNDGPAVLNAIEAWKNISGPAALHFETGKTYYLGERTDHKSYFLLNGLNDKVIEGNGALLILTPSNRGFTIENCDHVVVRNFSVDYSPLPFSQGVIISKNSTAGTITFQTSPGYPAPIREGNRTWGSVYDRVTQNLRTGLDDHIQMDGLTDLGNGIFQFQVHPSYVNNIAGMELNDLFVYRAHLDKGIPGSGDWAYIYSNGTVAFDNINLRCVPEFVFRPSENIKPCLFRNITISPPLDSGRLVASFGDGFHCNGNRYGPIIENGDFTYLMDDTMHIKSTGFQINSIAGNTITVSTSGHRIGDEFRFIDPINAVVLGQATLTGMDGNAIVLETIPPGVIAGHYIFNLTRGNAGFVVQNNYFGKKRRMAALFRGGSGKVLNNTADGNSGFWFMENGFFAGVLEGTRAENILFQGNTIRNCSQGVLITTEYTQMPIENIRIIDNVFEGPTNVSINGANNIEIIGNEFWTTPIANLSSNVTNVTIGYSTDENGKLIANERSLLTGSLSNNSDQIIIKPINYELWAEKAGLFGVDALMNSDPDADGMNNLLEYALDGNPTRKDATAVLPTFTLSRSGQNRVVGFVHKKRSNDSSLVYTVETSNDLTNGSWFEDEFTTSETPRVDDFITIKKERNVSSKTFIRLKVERE